MGEPDRDDNTKSTPQVRLVAAATRLSDSSCPRDPNAGDGHCSAFYKSAQWSADGTTVIASTSANTVLSYVLPANLLEPPPGDGPNGADNSDSSAGSDCDTSPSLLSSPHHRLAPQGRLALPEPGTALAPAPYFSLAEPLSQTILVACRDLPIQLHALFPHTGDGDARHTQRPRPLPVASYPLIKPETEAFLGPTALLWEAPGTHFVAGTTNLLALFDASRTANEPPLLRVPTIPSTRHLRKGNGVGMRGTVSALSRQFREQEGSGLVAAGTWTRWVGLYDLGRAGGDCVATWSVAGAKSDANSDPDPDSDVAGGGILQTLWSPCGRYLVINERRSRGLLVYDIRGTGALLCRLTGRPAETSQRLSCDVYMSASAGTDGGFEVWAGTEEGKAVVWEGVGRQGGAVAPSWDWAAHRSAMGSTAMHQSGSIVATCSGSWVLPSDDSNSSDDSDSLDGSEVANDTDGSDGTGSTTSSTSSTSSGSGRSSTCGLRTVSDASLKIWHVV